MAKEKKKKKRFVRGTDPEHPCYGKNNKKAQPDSAKDAEIADLKRRLAAAESGVTAVTGETETSAGNAGSPVKTFTRGAKDVLKAYPEIDKDSIAPGADNKVGKGEAEAAVAAWKEANPDADEARGLD